MSFGWDNQAGSSNCNDFDWPGALKAFSQADAQRLASFRLYYDPKTINDRLYAPGVYHHAVNHSGETVYAIDNWLCAPLEAIAKTADNRDSD